MELGYVWDNVAGIYDVFVNVINRKVHLHDRPAGGQYVDLLQDILLGILRFLNYAYENVYQALSSRHDNLITIREDECYISQPYGGYALRCDTDTPSVIIGVLVRRDTFFREYLSLLYRKSTVSDRAG